MPGDTRLKVVLCWHMHQPQYRDLISGEYQLPWTYLHAIKDYVDMAAHLEAQPSARVVVNFAPVLLEQIDDYAAQVRGFLTDQKAIRDPILAALAQPALPADAEARVPLIRACLRADQARMIGRFEPYRRLAHMAEWLIETPQAALYVQEQFLVDLLVWHHLAWLGETVRRSDARVRGLIDKGLGYTLHDRRELLAVIGDLLAGVVARYHALAESRRVELSATPYAHPILPLLLDFSSAREAIPDVKLPTGAYPNGKERVAWHLREARARHARHFGREPIGCWPSEGSISMATLDLLSQSGFGWCASGENVLRHTLVRAGRKLDGEKDEWLYRRYAGPGGMSVFFRDERLSDLIGFTYESWKAEDAVDDFVSALEQIAGRASTHPERVVSVILDGENPWEHYPENGYPFLTGLYSRLSNHPRIALATFADCGDVEALPLPPVIAGSWVYGTFSTWIGNRDKNRGWEMLCDAGRAFEAQRQQWQQDPAALSRVQEQLAVCEGSDWFWWFGEDNPAAPVSEFERLFRRHLTNLYQMLGLEPPQYLSRAFTRGAGMPAHSGTMRPGQAS